MVKGQLFYILAQGPKNNILFKDSKDCADYFDVTSQTINDRLARGMAILEPTTRTAYMLSRRPVVSKEAKTVVNLNSSEGIPPAQSGGKVLCREEHHHSRAS